MDKIRIISMKHLKLIAFITMLIDHIGAVLVEPYIWGFEEVKLLGFISNPHLLYKIMRGIGRIAFPLFCFNIVEGYFHTRDVKKYALRLFGLAILSEIPYDLAIHRKIFYIYEQNVIWALLLGLGAIYFSEVIFKRNILGTIFSFFLSCFLATLIHPDYSYLGIIFIFIFYIFRNRHIIRDILISIFLINNIPGQLALIPIELYNGKKGNQGRYFYLWNYFYPVHLFILWLIFTIFNPNGYTPPV